METEDTERMGQLLDDTFVSMKQKLEKQTSTFFDEQQNLFRSKLDALFRAHTDVCLLLAKHLFRRRKEGGKE